MTDHDWTWCASVPKQLPTIVRVRTTLVPLLCGTFALRTAACSSSLGCARSATTHAAYSTTDYRQVNVKSIARTTTTTKKSMRLRSPMFGWRSVRLSLYSYCHRTANVGRLHRCRISIVSYCCDCYDCCWSHRRKLTPDVCPPRSSRLASDSMADSNRSLPNDQTHRFGCAKATEEKEKKTKFFVTEWLIDTTKLMARDNFCKTKLLIDLPRRRIIRCIECCGRHMQIQRTKIIRKPIRWSIRIDGRRLDGRSRCTILYLKERRKHREHKNVISLNRQSGKLINFNFYIRFGWRLGDL